VLDEELKRGTGLDLTERRHRERRRIAAEGLFALHCQAQMWQECQKLRDKKYFFQKKKKGGVFFIEIPGNAGPDGYWGRGLT